MQVALQLMCWPPLVAGGALAWLISEELLLGPCCYAKQAVAGAVSQSS